VHESHTYEIHEERPMLDFENLKKMLSKPKTTRCTKMIVDPYARRSVKLSDKDRMEREREMARQRKWVALNDIKRKEKIQAYRQALADLEAELRRKEYIKHMFISLKDRILDRHTSRTLHREKHRRRQQQERERLAAVVCLCNSEEPDFDPEHFGFADE
jgi:hypothetical protein